MSLIIQKGIQIRKDIFNVEEAKGDDLGFGFEDLDGEANQLKTSPQKQEKNNKQRLGSTNAPP